MNPEQYLPRLALVKYLYDLGVEQSHRPLPRAYAAAHIARDSGGSGGAGLARKQEALVAARGPWSPTRAYRRNCATLARVGVWLSG